MAKPTDAMTPEAAVAAIAQVREYRQGLTARAAGIVWMVWALALAGVAALDVIVAPTLQVDPSVFEDGWSVQEEAWVFLLIPLALLVGAIVTTNAIWKAHSIERNESHKGWIAWAATIGLVVAVAAIGLFVVYLAITFFDPPTPDGPAFDLTYVFITPVLSAGAAFLIALLQRNRVAMGPGLLAAGLLLTWMFLAQAILSGDLAAKVANAGIVHLILVLGSMLAVGLWHFHRG